MSLATLSRTLAKARRLPWAERGLLLEAIFWLSLAPFGLRLIPFRRIVPFLGEHMAQPVGAVDFENARRARRVGWAVRAAALRTPWPSACLAQALSAKIMLRRRQISSTLYLGLSHGVNERLRAHAWLHCGNDVITGGDHSAYTVISSFTG